jgi:hypothetical protein
VQTHELDAFASGQFAVHVGELAAVADVHGGQLGPSRAGSKAEPLPEKYLIQSDGLSSAQLDEALNELPRAETNHETGEKR